MSVTTAWDSVSVAMDVVGARARLIEALGLLDSLRPLLNNKDAAEWESVWNVAYTEVLNRAREYIEAAAAAATNAK